jgi:hypothetical protein
MPKIQWSVIKVSDEPEQLFLIGTDLESAKFAGGSRMPLNEETRKHLENEKILSKTEIDALIEKAREDYRREKATMIEGTLDLIWANKEDVRATPQYKLLFLRYRESKGGGQPHKLIVGEDALEAYLLALNFSPDKAKGLIKEVEKDKSVSVPNVMIGEPHIKTYEK